MKYEYNYENKNYSRNSFYKRRSSQEKYGRLDIPHDAPEKHPEHLWQHNHLQMLQRHALNGDVEKCKEMLAELPEYQVEDTIEILKKSVREHGREIEL